jgi:hypothetical protein
MDRRTPPPEETHPGDLPTGNSARTGACHRPPAEGGKVLGLGEAFVKTIRHFWPGLNRQLDALPDTRYRPFVEYDRKFLAWWGLLLFSFKLGSRRQLDYDLRDTDLEVLHNLNRLAGTCQRTLPVHKTLVHFLVHIGSESVANLRTFCLRHLIRMKVLDACRLMGRFVIAIDGTGLLLFRREHCPRCLTQDTATGTLYLHPVLEAKLVDSKGLALSIGTEFIENPTRDDLSGRTSHHASLSDYEKIKQDCELKAFARLAPKLKKDFPQTSLCISADSLFACGPVIDICRQYGWSYIFTFKQGRTPDLWQDFIGMLTLVPENTLRLTLPDGTRQLHRWVNDIDYIDSDRRLHTLNAILCQESTPTQKHTFAWITDLKVNKDSVVAIASQGGRQRHKIENQGFNIQKNSGLNLEHAYSFDPDNIKAFYYLLQIAHIFLQLLEHGSLLKHLANAHQTSPIRLFGSLKNIAKRLLECFRYFSIPDIAFDPGNASRFQIRLDSS